jgi:hypothetical protein
VAGKPAGSEVKLAKPGTVTVRAKVAFAADTPVGVPYGTTTPAGGKRLVGDTVDLHGPLPPEESRQRGGKRRVEFVVNGHVAAAQEVPADDQTHELTFSVRIERSSWLAIRHFPQMHTNPVTVIVAGEPIRASQRSAQWCIGCIEQLWRVRGMTITPAERDEAHKTFQDAIKVYRRIAAEAPTGS